VNIRKTKIPVKEKRIAGQEELHQRQKNGKRMTNGEWRKIRLTSTAALSSLETKKKAGES
jgi:hypothetical protein